MTASSNAGEPDDDHAAPDLSGNPRERQGQAFGGKPADDREHQTRNVLALMRSVFARTIENGTSLEDVEAHHQGRFDTLARFLTSSGMDQDGAMICKH